MKITEFLEMLDDARIQDKILTIIKAQTAEKVVNFNKTPSHDVLAKQKADAEKMELQRRLSILSKQLEEESNKKIELEGQLRQKQVSYDNLLKENTLLQQKLTTEKQALLAKEKAYDDQYEANTCLQRENMELQDTVRRQEQRLQQIFPTGWVLYLQYQALSTEEKNLLENVFPRDSFAGFIVGGAKADSLDNIWDEVKRCRLQNNNEEADLLWQLFAYFLKLVNEGFSEDIYQIEEPYINDYFDIDIHIGDKDSRTQGRIARVLVPGYKNIYSGKLLKKSIVHVE